jgi:hypothetical protein
LPTVCFDRQNGQLPWGSDVYWSGPERPALVDSCRSKRVIAPQISAPIVAVQDVGWAAQQLPFVHFLWPLSSRRKATTAFPGPCGQQGPKIRAPLNGHGRRCDPLAWRIRMACEEPTQPWRVTGEQANRAPSLKQGYIR